MYQTLVSNGEQVTRNGQRHTVYRTHSAHYSKSAAIKEAQRLYAHAPLDAPVSVAVDCAETFTVVWRLDQ